MTFRGVKRISVVQGKQILKVCANADISDTEKICQCIKIYSGASDKEIHEANENHLKAIYHQILRLVLPEKILPINCSYINTDGKLYELDLDAAGGNLDNAAIIPDDIEKVLADHCIRFRYQGYGFKWEYVTNKETAAKDLLTANWRDAASCYLYLQAKGKDAPVLDD